jgi:hypothetical protein
MVQIARIVVLDYPHHTLQHGNKRQATFSAGRLLIVRIIKLTVCTGASLFFVCGVNHTIGIGIVTNKHILPFTSS